jgi:hypothetical protein
MQPYLHNERSVLTALAKTGINNYITAIQAVSAPPARRLEPATRSRRPPLLLRCR